MAQGPLTRWTSSFTTLHILWCKPILCTLYNSSALTLVQGPAASETLLLCFYQICWHLCGSDHLNSRGRNPYLSALTTAKYTCCCEAKEMLRSWATHHSMRILIASTLQSQDHHEQKDKDSKTEDTNHRQRCQAGESIKLYFVVTVLLRWTSTRTYWFCITSSLYLRSMLCFTPFTEKSDEAEDTPCEVLKCMTKLFQRKGLLASGLVSGSANIHASAATCTPTSCALHVGTYWAQRETSAVIQMARALKA